MNKAKQRPGDTDRLPPHSIEAEQGVLGCMLLSPNGTIIEAETKLGRSGEPFYDLRHRPIYESIIHLHDRNIPVDPISLGQLLKDHRQLEHVGGLQYLSSLPDAVPSAANLDHYAEIVRQKYHLRRMISTCTDIVGRVYDYEGEVESLLTTAQADLFRVTQPIGQSCTQQHWRIPELIKYDIDRDPNAVIGWHDGKATRYLCRGYGAWIIGQSGIGKSTFGLQQLFFWALGKPFCGITPVANKPPRCLIVQNENDLGDCAEATQGILECSAFTPAEVTLLAERVKIIRCRGKTGEAFCRWLEREVLAWKADIVYVDPLLRFAGIDVSRQDQCTKFLNDFLDPVLANTGVIMYGAHHTGKPKSAKETHGWTIYDHAYAGIGSSELVNWARAISIVRALPEGLFEVMLAKRGRRAWATHPSGDPTTSIFLRHSSEHIFWNQVDPPPVQPAARSGKPAGRPSKLQEIAGMNLFGFCSECKPEGEGLNELSKRLENWLAKEKVDMSLATCKRAIPLLVASGKILKNEASLYLKGPNA